MKLVITILMITLCIFMFCSYLQLRKDGDGLANRLGYGKDWRSVIKNDN